MILLADSEGPDQTARMRRLIRAFAARICPKNSFRMARPKGSEAALPKKLVSILKSFREAFGARYGALNIDFFHYENMPIQIYWKFYHQKVKIFRWKILIYFMFLLKT